MMMTMMNFDDLRFIFGVFTYRWLTAIDTNAAVMCSIQLLYRQVLMWQNRVPILKRHSRFIWRARRLINWTNENTWVRLARTRNSKRTDRSDDSHRNLERDRETSWSVGLTFGLPIMSNEARQTYAFL